jgi:hypothetical protein
METSSIEMMKYLPKDDSMIVPNDDSMIGLDKSFAEITPPSKVETSDSLASMSEKKAAVDVVWIGNPKRFALIELNKIDGDNPELNGYLHSVVHHEIDRSNPVETGTSCRFRDVFKELVGDKEFCAGELVREIPTEYTFIKEEESSSYGHSTLKWGYSGFSLDRVNLNASKNVDYLGDPEGYTQSYQYQCEVVSKDTYDQKFQEVESKVKAAADAHRAELAERESETPQI